MGSASAANSSDITSTQDIGKITDNDKLLTVESSSTENIDYSAEILKENTDNELLTNGTVKSFSDVQTLIDDADEGNTIYLDGKTYIGNGTSININKTLTICGGSNPNDNVKSIFNASDLSSIFTITGINVTLNNLILTDGNSNYGGAINWNADNGKLTDCTFTSNYATSDDGVVYWEGADGEITDCDFTDNNATDDGSVVYISGSLEIFNSVFENNNASNGQIYNKGNLKLSNSIFTDDSESAQYDIMNSGTLTLYNNTLSNCICHDSGEITSEVNVELLDNQTFTACVGDEVILYATLTDDNGNTICVEDFTITANDDEEYATFNSTTRLYECTYTLPQAGIIIVNTSYTSDKLNVFTGTYNSVKNNVTLEVDLNNETFEGETLVIIADVNHTDATGRVFIQVDDVIFSGEVSDGVATIDVDGLTEGNYTAVVYYEGDDKFASAKTTVNIAVIPKLVPVINITVPEGMIIGKDTYVNVTIDGATGNVSVFVDGLKKVLYLVNGTVKYMIDEINGGQHGVVVIYDGDETHIAAYNSTNFFLEQFATNFANVTVEDNQISAVLVNALGNPIDNATISYIIYGVESNITTDSNGRFVIRNIEGKYVIINYAGEDAFFGTSISVTLNQTEKLNTTVSAEGAEIFEGETAVIIANVTPTNATGIVLVEVDGVIFSNVIIDGVATIDVDGLIGGNYTAIVYYGGDNNFRSAETTVNITVVPKYAPVINITVPEGMVIGKDTYVNVTIDGATGNVSVFVDGSKKVLYLVNGTVKYMIDEISGGEHGVVVIYDGDETHAGAYNSTIFFLEQFATNFADITVGDEISAALVNSLGDPITNATIIYTIDNMTLETKTDLNGRFGIAFVEGKYVTITYEGEDAFAPATMSISLLNTTKQNATITATGDEIIEGEDAIVTAHVTENATGRVLVDIDNKLVYGNIIDGMATIRIDGLTKGNYAVIVFYAGDDNFTSAITTANIAVTAKTISVANITVPVGIEIGEDAPVTVSIPNATGNVTVIVDDDENIISLDENGTATYTIEAITGGNHNIVVIYSGDKTHTPVYNTSNIYLEEYGSRFDNITISGDLVITGVLVNSFGDPISNEVIAYTVGDLSGNLTTGEDGSFIILGENGAKVTIDYAGNNTVDGTSLAIVLANMAQTRLASQFNVTEGQSIKTYAVDNTVGERGTPLPFQLTDSDGNPIANATVQFAYKTSIFNRTTDENGLVYLTVGTQVADFYLCALSYLGDETHNATFVAFNFEVVKKPITIKAGTKTFKSAQTTKTYTAILKTEKCASRDGKVYLKSGKTVTLKINGVTYTAKTDENGKAVFSIQLTKRGIFTARVTFAGDKTYESATTTTKITIK